ncbi:hypothetical protein NHQ30_002184 [Ciborinia camelliae]|nr:hypothetical protein NHQ30_002184 [Ciborinia camelliae]
MAGFLSTLRKSCKTLLTSFTSTISTLKKWFHPRHDIASTIYRLYRNDLRPLVLRILRFIGDHRLAVAIGVFSIITIFHPGIITVPLLRTLGFMMTGPVAGSIAALTQAMIGNVTSGSLFAILQSGGMAGFGLMTINAIVIGITTFALVAVLVYLWKNNKGQKEKAV